MRHSLRDISSPCLECVEMVLDRRVPSELHATIPFEVQIA